MVRSEEGPWQNHQLHITTTGEAAYRAESDRAGPASDNPFSARNPHVSRAATELQHNPKTESLYLVQEEATDFTDSASNALVAPCSTIWPLTSTVR